MRVEKTNYTVLVKRRNMLMVSVMTNTESENCIATKALLEEGFRHRLETLDCRGKG